jgi:acetyl-CoA carboxylase beta subunit
MIKKLKAMLYNAKWYFHESRMIMCPQCESIQFRAELRDYQRCMHCGMMLYDFRQ